MEKGLLANLRKSTPEPKQKKKGKSYNPVGGGGEKEEGGVIPTRVRESRISGGEKVWERKRGGEGQIRGGKVKTETTATKITTEGAEPAKKKERGGGGEPPRKRRGGGPKDLQRRGGGGANGFE